MRCKYCQGLSIERLVELAETEFKATAFPQNAYYTHQPTIAALDTSAEQGCDLCQLIVQALESTSYNACWAEELLGLNHTQDSTILATARGLADFYDTAIRICINTMHVIWGTTLSDVEMLEMLLIQVGLPRSEDDMLSDDDEDYAIAQPGLHPADLLMTARGSPSHYKQYKIGRSEIDPALNSESNLAVAKKWISKCRTEHRNACGALKDESILPTRVIDVGSIHSHDRPRLFISHDAKADYIALSHCWGGPIDTVLETTNINDFCQALPYDQMPLNFKDAIKITRGLSVRYLWIDSLCIIQNSSDDWAIESAKMASVYQNALLTIAALCSPRSSHGIFTQITQNLTNSPDIPLAGPNGTQLTLQVYKEAENENLRDLIAKAPLSSRGWCFQESVLSRRLLFYGVKQIYWECSKGFQSANEIPGTHMFPGSGAGVGTFSEFLRFDINTKSVLCSQETRTKLLWNYYSAVSSYTRRKLTFNTDKLPAFSGLAQRLNPLIGGDYVAGLWTADLAQGLLWAIFQGGSSIEHVKPYRAPSWSWASRNGAIYFRRSVGQQALRPTDVEVLEVQVEPKEKRAPYGEVTTGHLVLRGLTLGLRRIHGKEIEASDQVGQIWFDEIEMADGKTGSVTYLFTDRVSEHDPAICVGPARSAFDSERVWKKALGRQEQKDYLILWVKSREEWVDPDDQIKDDIVKCIVLDKVCDTGVGNNVYRRVGYFATYPGKDRVVGQWQIRTLKII
ncbi:hypothetical protein FAVG1_04856 [Fusarium avenaceum]|nr:hypothetical protein FAVG1_04856 [Fusarium avenaceum]